MSLDQQVSREFSCRVDRNGRVLIPHLLRRALGISTGNEVLLRVRNGELQITTQRHRIELARTRARRYLPKGVSLVDELRRIEQGKLRQPAKIPIEFPGAATKTQDVSTSVSRARPHRSQQQRSAGPRKRAGALLRST